MVSGDSREGMDSSVGLEDEDDEKLLKRAIALSLEGTEENDNGEEEEELMLRQAIALSLEGAEEEADQEK